MGGVGALDICKGGQLLLCLHHETIFLLNSKTFFIIPELLLDIYALLWWRTTPRTGELGAQVRSPTTVQRYRRKSELK